MDIRKILFENRNQIDKFINDMVCSGELVDIPSLVGFEIHEIEFEMDFYEKVLRNIQTYAGKWKLSSFQLINSSSVKHVFSCISESLGNVVLIIANPSSKEFTTELTTLREYNGKRFCKVIDFDIENGVILEECIKPGNTLREEISLDKRLSLFSELYKDLHITPSEAEIYPTYTGWVNRITEYMCKRDDCKELYLHMKRARDICILVSSKYSQKLLLHGDLHHDNILLGNEGEYRIIDPKGVIGDPVFDIARFILNEFSSEINMESFEKINYIISKFEEKLNIPSNILKLCLYVETAMAMCWCVEDGAAAEEYKKHLMTVRFAETILIS
jgi:streptomycin 6-kinase